MDQDFSDLLKTAIKQDLLQARSAVLLTLHSRHGLGLTSSEVGALTGISQALLSYTKKELSGAGYVEAHQPFRDQRVSKLYLTAAGKEKAEELRTHLCGLARMLETHWNRQA
jgi:DNA-binding MarR family transcriptional regulator